MGGKMLEVECPVCDHTISVDAVRCPNCDAVFSLSGVDELQKVARELNDPAPEERPTETPKEPLKAEVTIAQGPKTPDSIDPKEKGGLLGKLFKKKK
jgi:uncharacterized Zn finger protein (UPF0148 family)